MFFFKTSQGQLFSAMILVLLLGEGEKSHFSVRNLNFVHLIFYFAYCEKHAAITASVKLSGCLTILYDMTYYPDLNHCYKNIVCCISEL